MPTNSNIGDPNIIQGQPSSLQQGPNTIANTICSQQLGQIQAKALNKSKQSNQQDKQNVNPASSKYKWKYPIIFPKATSRLQHFPHCTVSPAKFEDLLHNFDRKDYTVMGFAQGFLTHYQGNQEIVEAQNSNTTQQNPEAVDELVDTEMVANRLLGPYDKPPYTQYKVTPISIREKSKPGTYRLLHNLTYPYDERSVNLGIPQEYTTVKYAGIQDAISLIQKLGPGCSMAKSDLKNAFRHVPIHPSQHHLMGFKWRHKYYFDKFLAMGLSESCRIFETVSDAIVHILNTQYSVTNVVKIIDDFLFIEKDQKTCEKSLQTFLQLALHLGFTIAWDKTTKIPQTTIVFVGIELNSVTMTAKLPQDKLLRYATNITETLKHKSVTVAHLQSIVGQLQFATSVVKGGRPFLRRLIDLQSESDKPYWHIKLTAGAIQDLRLWLSFLANYNGVTIITQSPITESNAITLYTDASKLGYGATYGSYWLQGRWTPEQTQLNIAVLELYPIFLVVSQFAQKLAGARLLFHCDNEAIVQVINKQTCRDKSIMKLLRPLILVLLNNNITFIAKHIRTENNHLADAISRFQVSTVLLEHYGMRHSPTPSPPHLLLANYIT